MLIPKGCTLTNTFTFPFLKEDVSALYITYSQNGKEVVEKNLNDCEFVDNRIHVLLSQEETLRFDENLRISVQIRVRLNDGTVTKSEIIRAYADPILKEGVI